MKRRFETQVKLTLESEVTPFWEKERLRQKIVIYRLALAFMRPAWGLACLILGASIAAVVFTVTARVQPKFEQLSQLTTASMLVLVFAYACAWWLDGVKSVKVEKLSGVLVFSGLAIFGGMLVKDGIHPLVSFFVAVSFSYLLLTLNVVAAYLVMASLRARVRQQVSN